MYGTQTLLGMLLPPLVFENDVKMYGTQTQDYVEQLDDLFENDVKMYGTQTAIKAYASLPSLRMM